MKVSRLLAVLLAAALLIFAVACDDDDDDVVQRSLNSGVVESALEEAIPVAIEFPVGLIEILLDLPIAIPGKSGQQACEPIEDLCTTSGSAEACDIGGGIWELRFDSCVTDDATSINGTGRVTVVNETTVQVEFQSGFTLDGEAVTGQMTITGLSSVVFNALALSIDAVDAQLDGGPMIVDIVTDTVNGQITTMFISSSAFPSFSANVLFDDNDILATAQDGSSPPRAFTCQGAVLEVAGELSVTLDCVEAEPF